MKKYITFLFFIILSVSCEGLFPYFGFEDEKEDISQDEGNNNDDEIVDNPTLPTTYDIADFNGWDNVRFVNDGTVIFTRNHENTQIVSKSLILMPTYTYGVIVMFGEYDTRGIPTYLAVNENQIYVEKFEAGYIDAVYMDENGTNMYLEKIRIDDLIQTKAWNENNFARNYAAVGQVITGVIGIGVGVGMFGTGPGAVGGAIMIGSSCKSLDDNFKILFGPGEDYADDNDLVKDQVTAVGMEAITQTLSADEKSFLKIFAPKWFTESYSGPNTFWASLGFSLVDGFWGETKTLSETAKEALRDSQKYRIETLNAEEITSNSALVHGYVAPESLSPLGNSNATVKYGIVAYNLLDTSQRKFNEYTDKKGGEISLYCENLKSGTPYAYFTFYSDLTNAIVRFADQKMFTTKGEMLEEDHMPMDEQERILREYLVKFYEDTDGDNWFNNKNWCTDKPLDEWFGVSDLSQISLEWVDHWSLTLHKNNLKGHGDLSGCNIIQSVFISGNEELTGIDLSDCKRLETAWIEANYSLKTIDVSNTTRLQSVNFNNNQDLSFIDFTGSSAVDCDISSNTSLTKLNLSNNGTIHSLHCMDNPKLTNIDLSNCANLIYASCCDNSSLSDLDLSGCISLESLVCNNNKLTTLNVSDCKKIDYIECINNRLTDIIATGCTELYDVSCQYNRITKEISGVWANLGLFDYDHRYTGYWYDDDDGVWHYTDNGVGWWWPGEPHEGPHNFH